MTGESPTQTRYTRLQVRRVQKGSGNACAFVFSDRSLGFVDWGTDDIQCLSTLLSAEHPTRIRFVVATHSHNDHTMGLRTVLEECVKLGLTVDNFYYPSVGRLQKVPSDLWKAIIYATNERIPVHPVSVQDFRGVPPSPPILIARSNEWDINLLAPPSSSNSRHQITSHIKGVSSGGRQVNPGNPTSIVLLFRYFSKNGPKGRALLPGDATPAVLKFSADHANRDPSFAIDNDAMVAPHHGSHHNWPNWLTAHAQGFVVVSASGSHHHPSQSFLQQLGPQLKQGGNSQLFCTTYSHHCRQAFGLGAQNPSLVGPDVACFGDVEIELDPTGSKVLGHDPLGAQRRSYGHCN